MCVKLRLTSGGRCFTSSNSDQQLALACFGCLSDARLPMSLHPDVYCSCDVADRVRRRVPHLGAAVHQVSLAARQRCQVQEHHHLPGGGEGEERVPGASFHPSAVSPCFSIINYGCVSIEVMHCAPLVSKGVHSACRPALMQVCLLDLDYNLPVQVRDQALAEAGEVVEALPQSDAGREYALNAMSKEGMAASSFANAAGNDTIMRLQRTTPYYKVRKLLSAILWTQQHELMGLLDFESAQL